MNIQIGHMRNDLQTLEDQWPLKETDKSYETLLQERNV